MTRQIIFAFCLFLTLAIFTYTISRFARFFGLTRPAFSVRDLTRRLLLMASVALGQTKIFRRPVTGFFHALVFWGFCVIALGSIEMVIDGLTGSERSLKFLGGFYSLITASGDIFALLVTVSILIFLVRRLFFHVRRFEGIEMKRVSHLDANLALTMILVLMISLLAMNTAYVAGSHAAGNLAEGVYPVSVFLASLFTGPGVSTWHLYYESSWWLHILLIFAFANILPYSKHFHVFMSVPNVFLSRLDPLGKLPNMDQITREVKLMLDPSAQIGSDQTNAAATERFGVRDVEDVSWKNYLDALSCTECGRCTASCPANMTGKRLSPRKIIMDVRARMKEKGPGLVKNGRGFDDQKALLRSYITEEELWACTTCNACAQECPININHPTLIVDMRRYLVLEEGSAPGGIKAVFANIENNGAPWQYSPEDRLLWTNNLEMQIKKPL